jgi:hypothetical protein
MTMFSKNQVINNLRDKNNELKGKLEAVKKLYENIPVISMPSLTCEEDAIKEYIRDMTIWGEKLQKLL